MSWNSQPKTTSLDPAAISDSHQLQPSRALDRPGGMSEPSPFSVAKEVRASLLSFKLGLNIY